MNISDAIPILKRMVRYFFGGALIPPPDEYGCWKCGHWLFYTRDGIPYCVWCGHSHRPPTGVYRAALYFAVITEEGTLIIV